MHDVKEQLNLFDTMLNNKQFKEALQLFHTLNEEQQILLISRLNVAKEQQESLLDLAELKTASLLFRRLKPGKTYDDFYQAWLPPKDNQHPGDNSLKNYFGMQGAGCVLHARNIEDPQEIISIGLMSVTKNELNKIISDHMAGEMQRHENITTVSDKLGKTKLLEIIDVID